MLMRTSSNTYRSRKTIWRRSSLALCLCGVVLSPLPLRAANCDGVIDRGDSADEVVRKCGVADQRDDWEEWFIEKPAEGFEREIGVHRSEWIYDLGPERFLRVFSFRNEVLQNIETRHYGGDRPTPGCRGRLIETGDTKLEVLHKCGEPNSREQSTEYRTEPIDPVHRRRFPIVTERWRYLPSGDALPRVIVFRNRRVVDVERGGGR